MANAKQRKQRTQTAPSILTERSEGTAQRPRPPAPELLRRVVIENVTPQIDEGRFPAKRTLGEDVVVEADAFADGHDVLAAVMLWRRRGETTWTEVPMAPL